MPARPDPKLKSAQHSNPECKRSMFSQPYFIHTTNILSKKSLYIDRFMGPDHC